MTIRAPHFSQRVEREVQPPQIVPNLLVTTLAVTVGALAISEPVFPEVQQQPIQLGKSIALVEAVVPAPFGQHDWPNPRTSGLLEVLQVGRSITAVPGAPFAQLDWPNPETLFVQQPEQIGKSIALIEALAKPFLQTDWPNPHLAVEIQSPDQSGKSIALVEAAVAAPFFQTDWPNPELLPIQAPLQVVKPFVLGTPFAQLDWINPPSIETQQPFQIGKSIALVAPVVGDPFAQHDWPNPVIPSFVDAFSRGPLIIPPAPFKQTDWPNPILTTPIQQPFQLTNSLALLEGQGEKPFLQSDWPNPEPIFIKQLEQVGKSATLVEAVVAVVTITGDTALSETDIRAGGKQTIITLTGDTWQSSGTAFNQVRQIILDGITSAQTEETGWNKEVRDKQSIATVIRTSDTVVTITWTQAPDYDVLANEVITVTVPAAALVGSTSEAVATPTIGVTADIDTIKVHEIRFSSVSRSMSFSCESRSMDFSSASRSMVFSDKLTPDSFILLEDGGKLLLEDGFALLKESE